MTATCVHRSQAGITCGCVAVTYIAGQALCAIHAQMSQAKKGVKRGK